MKKQILIFKPYHKISCSPCKGTGKVFSDDSNSTKLEECEKCDGIGEVYKYTNHQHQNIDLDNNIFINENEEEDF